MQPSVYACSSRSTYVAAGLRMQPSVYACSSRSTYVAAGLRMQPSVYVCSSRSTYVAAGLRMQPLSSYSIIPLEKKIKNEVLSEIRKVEDRRRSEDIVVVRAYS
uniref:Uncharacterized protein n=1 Tax=Haemonchus contortus TaxID=6289 RepID=A0A7I4YBZ1_HAECO